MGRRASQTALITTVGTLICATVWFGATNPAALAIAELPIYAAGILLVASRDDLFSSRYRTPLDLPVLAFVLLPLFHLIPLPSPVVTTLSPGLSRLRASLGLSIPSLLPLSSYPYVTFQALNRVAAAALVYFIITRTITGTSHLRGVLLALTWLGIGEAAYGLTGYLLESPTILAGRPQLYPGSATGTLICKNHFAGLMELLLPVSLAYYWAFGHSARDPRPREETPRMLLLLVAPSIMVLAIIFSRSRAGIVSLGLALAVMLTLIRQSRAGNFGRVALLVLAGAILIYGNAIGLDPVIERFQELDKTYALSRVEIWRDGLRLALLSPLFGSGIGTWASLFPTVKTTAVQLTFSHAHNDYIQALAEGGIIGLTILCWLLLKAYTVTRTSLTNSATTRPSRLAAAALFAGILSLALHGFVDFNLQIPGNLFLFMAIAALLSVVSQNPHLLQAQILSDNNQRVGRQRSIGPQVLPSARKTPIDPGRTGRRRHRHR